MHISAVDLSKVQLLKWPRDASTIAQLDLIEFQCWFAGQPPRDMVFLGQNPKFRRFLKIHYLWPLKAKRMVYRIKSRIREVLHLYG